MRWYRSSHSGFDVLKHDGEWHSEFASPSSGLINPKPLYVIYRTSERKKPTHRPNEYHETLDDYVEELAKASEVWWLLHVENWEVSGPYESAVEAKNSLLDTRAYNEGFGTQ